MGSALFSCKRFRRPLWVLRLHQLGNDIDKDFNQCVPGCVAVWHVALSWRPAQDGTGWWSRRAPCAAAGGTCWRRGPDRAGSVGGPRAEPAVGRWGCEVAGFGSPQVEEAFGEEWGIGCGPARASCRA